MGEHGELPHPAGHRGVGSPSQENDAARASYYSRNTQMPGPIDYTKLRILPDFDTAEWWAGTKQHKYLVRQCKACGHKWFPPIFPACAKCASMDVGWFETRGKIV